MAHLPLVPRPLRTWLRNRRRLRYAIERHPVPTLTAGEKRQHLIDWVRRSGVEVFVETGTYRGETTLALRGAARGERKSSPCRTGKSEAPPRGRGLAKGEVLSGRADERARYSLMPRFDGAGCDPDHRVEH